MRDLNNVVRASFVVGIFAAAFAAGCSSAATSDSDSSEGPIQAGGASLQGFESFHPQGDEKTYYSGYDGANDYIAPIAFFADKQPTVTFSDPSVAKLQGKLTITKDLVSDLPDVLDGKLQLLMVKTTKAGETTITATAGKVTQKATLKVTQYSPDDVKLGEERYNEGAPSCNSCHEKKSVHNPSVLVDLSDQTILGIAVDGKSIEKISPDTGILDTLKPNGGNHKWTVTEKERKGLMAYLRSRSLTFQRP